MKKKTKSVIVAINLILVLVVDFLAVNLKLDIGPGQGSDGYALNNDPLNIIIRWIASILGVVLLWYFINLITGSKKWAFILTIILIPILLIGAGYLSYGLG